MGFETITFDVDQGVGLLTLNRPKNLNAINQRMVDEIMAVQEQVRTDSAVNALVLAGNGRSFCAGYDLKEADAGESQRNSQFQGRGTMKSPLR